MQTQVIEQGRWNEYLGDLSRKNLNQLVTIEVIGETRGDQVIADHVPLIGISPDLKGSEAVAVDIEVGRDGSPDRLMHEVTGARQVMVQLDDSGAVQALDIEGMDSDGDAPLKTVITFHRKDAGPRPSRS